MPTINMRSTASKVKGQGVGSCYEEQVRLVSDGLRDDFEVYINSKKKCDIIHYHTINLNYYFERVMMKKKASGIGYVHFIPDTLEDSLDMPRSFKKIFYKYVLTFYNSMDYLVVVNPRIIERLRDYGVREPKIIYIPNYVSEHDFYEQSAEKIAATKEELNLSKDRFTVLGVGQLQTRKGISDFIEVAKRMPDVQFLWAGGFSFGRLSDGHDEIKAMTKVPVENIRFLGILDRERMVDIYNAADLMFLPSYDELFPMTVLEACCCGIPMLLRDIPVYEGVFFDCYMKSGSVPGFVEMIKEVRDDPDRMSYWKGKSWECHKYYSEPNILCMWERLYKEASVKPTKRRSIKKAYNC